MPWLLKLVFAAGPLLEDTEERWWTVGGKSLSVLVSPWLWLTIAQSVVFSLKSFPFANFCAPGEQKELPHHWYYCPGDGGWWVVS